MFKIGENWGKNCKLFPNAQHKSGTTAVVKMFLFPFGKLILAEKKELLSLLQQKDACRSLRSFPMLAVSKIYAPLKMLLKLIGYTTFFGKIKLLFSRKLSLEDANVTYFDNGYIGYSICRRRKHPGCKVSFAG